MGNEPIKMVFTDCDYRIERTAIPININQTVFVKLTERGEQIALHDSYIEFKRGWYNSKLEEGYYRMSLWEFARIFGEYFYCGCQQMVVENTIYIEQAEDCCCNCGKGD